MSGQKITPNPRSKPVPVKERIMVHRDKEALYREAAGIEEHK